MVERSIHPLDAIFGALADPTRRAILRELSASPLHVGELGTPLPMSLAAVSKHVKVLERAGLVTQTVEGRRRLCTLDAAPLRTATDWLDHYECFWNEGLDVLQSLLDVEPPPATKRRRRRSP